MDKLGAVEEIFIVNGEKAADRGVADPAESPLSVIVRMMGNHPDTSEPDHSAIR